MIARDAWSDASVADEYAYRLQHEANRTSKHTNRMRALFARRSNAAADAFEVAADGWEIVDDHEKAEIRRELAAYHRGEAFTASHRHMSYGWYLVTDAEARRLARASGQPLPKPGYVQPVRLSYGGPFIELHRIQLSEQEKWTTQRKRSWAWAVGNIRTASHR